MTNENNTEDHVNLYFALDEIERKVKDKIVEGCGNIVTQQLDMLQNAILQIAIDNSNNIHHFLSNEIYKLKNTLKDSHQKSKFLSSYKGDSLDTGKTPKRKASPIKHPAQKVIRCSPAQKNVEYDLEEQNQTVNSKEKTAMSNMQHLKTSHESSISEESKLAMKSSPMIAQKLYSCEICHYSSYDNDTLKNHIKVLHKEKRYNCDSCEKSFSKSSSLKKHMHVHTQASETQVQRQYIINQILDRRVSHNQVEYLVHWVGYGLEESTWEPKSSLEKSTPLLVQQVEIAQSHSEFPGEKYCICNGIDNGSPMVQCEFCTEWFHYTCLNLNSNSSELKGTWKCVKCKIVKKYGSHLKSPLNLHNTTF